MADKSAKERKKERRRQRKTSDRGLRQWKAERVAANRPQRSRKRRRKAVSESPATRSEEAVKRGHNRRKQEKIQEKDITGLKYFDKLNPLLERLHEEGCERDTAGNRQLHFDHLFLLLRPGK